MQIQTSVQEQHIKNSVYDYLSTFLKERPFPLLKIIKMTGDASLRQYYRIFVKHPHIPFTSLIACKDSYDYQHVIIVNKVEVNHFLAHQKIDVPKIYYVDKKRSLILQEDLGEKTFLQFVAQDTTIQKELDAYLNVLHILINMQNISKNQFSSSYFFPHLRFSVEKYLYEISYTYDHLWPFLHHLDKHQKGCQSKDQLKKLFRPILEKNASLKDVFVHRDFHSRNIMMVDKRCVLIDYQDARLGSPLYDLASLLDDVYYCLSPQNKKNLLIFYWENKGKEYLPSFDEFLYVYHMSALQRIFKALGNFSAIYLSEKRVDYLRYIGLGMEKIKNIFLEYEDHPELKNAILGAYYGY
jgi:aminoglycoside/choline kinase family phosphotransferase